MKSSNNLCEVDLTMSTKSEGELLELLIELNNDNSSPHILNDVKLKLASLKQNFL